MDIMNIDFVDNRFEDIAVISFDHLMFLVWIINMYFFKTVMFFLRYRIFVGYLFFGRDKRDPDHLFQLGFEYRVILAKVIGTM